MSPLLPFFVKLILFYLVWLAIFVLLKRRKKGGRAIWFLFYSVFIVVIVAPIGAKCFIWLFD